MRRADREVAGTDAIEAIIAKGTVCRIAFHGGEYPYIVPLNYGFVRQGDALTLYFHCACEGEKLERMRENPRVAFEITAEAEIYGYGKQDNACAYSTAYESVIGRGELAEVRDAAERREGIVALMRQAVPDRAFTITDEMLAGVTVLRLSVHTITGKRSPRRA